VERPARASRWPRVLLGLGLGGFIDGIVLHQILQWHHMVSHVGSFPAKTLQGLEVNTLADGIFHLGAWLLVLAGSTAAIASWRRGQLAPSWRFHFGLVVAGWGIFNLVEGLVDHQLLQIHHVRDDLGGPWQWDVGFLLFGLLLIGGGLALHRQGGGAVGRPAPAPGTGSG
jgi:uncharacterized membrane protein